ncbi:helix-turn-helix domain-containing protein [Leifsonia sp. NPDC058230]|uniref:helix-turn-helix domain-containing protein n=1 Tax=Leifsonia sp. NPDC058230 TaxID=3346391 RepID=UPI0036D8E19E
MPEPHSLAAQTFGERVRRARVDLGISQESVADLAQMHVTNFGKIERGCANPSLHTIIRIASVLGVDPAALLGGIGVNQLPSHFHVLTAAEFVRERRSRR